MSVAAPPDQTDSDSSAAVWLGSWKGPSQHRNSWPDWAETAVYTCHAMKYINVYLFQTLMAQFETDSCVLCCSVKAVGRGQCAIHQAAVKTTHCPFLPPTVPALSSTAVAVCETTLIRNLSTHAAARLLSHTPCRMSSLKSMHALQSSG